jgi:hypothetical protein
MSSYKPGDSKKEEFRKYLEKAGVLDALTKTLVSLYEEPEKPNNALDFLRKHLCNIFKAFFSSTLVFLILMVFVFFIFFKRAPDRTLPMSLN